MKTIITSILVFAMAQHLSATSYFNQLCEFNPNWQNYESRVPQTDAVQFSSEVEYIQAHLTSVLTILRSNPTEQLTSAQLNSREHLIQVLDAYREAGRFPINYYMTQRIPVFIDEHNTHCAVGFLMRESGFGTLAREIAANDNYVWVKDITDQRVIEWQVNAGFTIEELKIIQGAYDYYSPNAFYAPDRYETPQKPECKKVYFEDKRTGEELEHTEANVWFEGVGKNGVLNGKWVQNYGVGIPWIEGYFKNGKRTGQWKEYYQGTNILCRTENWRDDKLNGMRIRFDREGVIIEEIMFKDGNAVTKTNYDRAQGTKSIRTPLDSVNLYTEVYTLEGRLLASGNEQVHNPGNLLWFQNIELTALNSAAISARTDVQGFVPSGTAYFDPGPNGLGMYHGPVRRTLFQTPSLVEYKKQGKWIYYLDTDASIAGQYDQLSIFNRIKVDFQHYKKELGEMIITLDEIGLRSQFDSIVVQYENNMVSDFIGYSDADFRHFHFTYHEPSNAQIPELANFNNYFGDMSFTLKPKLKTVGEYNSNGMRIGEWKHYDVHAKLFKVETYLIPQKEEELVLGLN